MEQDSGLQFTSFFVKEHICIAIISSDPFQKLVLSGFEPRSRVRQGMSNFIKCINVSVS
jgi:hypothetical protein